MQNAILGMRTINVSQGNNAWIPSKNYFSNDASHMGINALDLAGEDTGKDVWRAKNRWKCVAVLPYSTTGFANTCLFSPCDEFGNLVEVNTPSGIKPLTIALTHDDTIRVEVGKVYEGEIFIYREGVTGKVTGAHIHGEACFAFVTSKVKLTGSQYYGGAAWVLPDAVPLHEALFLLNGYNIIKDGGGYDWQWVDSIESEVKEEMITKDESKGVYGVDLSTYDKDTIDWEKLAKQAKFAILRCGYGADKDGQHDDTFFEFCKKCDEYGIKKGAYIYSYAENEQEAINEANHIIRLCNEAGGDFPVGLFLDMEDKLQSALSTETNTKNVLTYINRIWTTSYKAGFYSMQSFMDTKVDMSQIVGNAIIWVANFGVNDGYYHDITTSFEYDIRQYTSINADKDFSSRSGLDQNLHFAFDEYLPQEPEIPDEPEVPIVEEKQFTGTIIIDGQQYEVKGTLNKVS